jgi:DNA-binding NarL/FixJ family response regulator
MRILIAEDSALLREALIALLERLGHTVVGATETAPQLEDAFAGLDSAPDIIITDVRMPPGNKASGGTTIDPHVVQHLLSTARPGPLDTLTPRETEVLVLMADGQSNAAIAEKLVLSDPAVGKHVGRIFQKLGLSPVDENRRVKAVLTYLQASRTP